MDPFGCVVATRGDVRIKIGRPESARTRGDGWLDEWVVARAIVSEIKSSIRAGFGALRILFSTETFVSWLGSSAVLSTGDDNHWRLVVLDLATEIISVVTLLFSGLGSRSVSAPSLLSPQV